MTRDEAKKYRSNIERAAKKLSDEDALDSVPLFPEWRGVGVQYAADDRVRWNGVLYRVLIAHTSQESWNPADAPSLFARVLIPDPNAVPEWGQPDSTNTYSTGDKVTHSGKTWISDINGNVWEPGVYGWTEVAG